MRTSALLGMLCLLVASPLYGTPDPMPKLRLAPGSSLRVSGTATIGSFTCETDDIRLLPVGATADGGRSADLRVPASKLDCGNRIINSHMRATLQADEYPEIALQLSFPERAWASGGGEVSLDGWLILGGTPRPVTVKANVGPGKKGTLRIRGAHEVLLSDHRLETPSFLMKMLTVHDQVTVLFDLHVVR